MKYLIYAILLGTFLLPATAFAGVDEGDKPTFVLTTLDGQTVSSDKLRGKVVLVDFWATWCGPCKEALPFYSKLVDNYDGELIVVAPSVDADAATVRAYLKGKKLALSVVWNEDHKLAKLFGPSMFPMSYLIDRQGVVRHVHHGFDDEIGQQTSAQIEALLAHQEE